MQSNALCVSKPRAEETPALISVVLMNAGVTIYRRITLCKLEIKLANRFKEYVSQKYKTMR